MTNTQELVLLRHHIQELSSEIFNIKKLITPYISTAEYKTLHARFQSLSNLKLIAKNELEAAMHFYKIVLSGKVTTEKSGLVDKVLRRRVKIELDCNLQLSRNLDISIPSHLEMYHYIQKTYAQLFEHGKFKIRSVIQLR
ncbi:hypothetical protein CNR22_04600 [Sphingobacteriaceae bacterium]|nr:hypothetical protein CNR22_04600 [Sphingobacteriaceae bacterium]